MLTINDNSSVIEKTSMQAEFVRFTYDIEKAAKALAMKTWSPRSLSVMLQKDKKDLNAEDRRFQELFYDKHPAIKETEQFISRLKTYFKSKKKVH